MKNEEKKLFKKLCGFKSKCLDENMLQFATPTVLGLLFLNRMQGVAYGTLMENNMLGCVNREFRNSLKNAYEQNIQKNGSFFECIKYLCDILSETNCKYAMLKGALLCSLYPKGYRTSNDIDILVHPKNITKIANVLSFYGFKQGNVRNGEFVPATRKEIIESKMMRGETVPYIKEINLPAMKYLEVDINFSLDYKNSSPELVESVLDSVVDKRVLNFNIPTFNDVNFFIHLCSHLYKEATTLPWIQMNRDMTLYKYCDIYLLLSNMHMDEMSKIFNRAKEFGIEKICAYAIMQTACLFELENPETLSIANTILESNPDFVHQVYSPKDNSMFIYREKDIFERFFLEERYKNLKELRK